MLPSATSQPVLATNLPGQPIAMQPMPGQHAMNPAGPTVTPLHLLTERAEWVDCQMCHKRAMTRVATSGEGMQFLTGAILCLVCICLAPLPCCLHWFEETSWFCTECNQKIAHKTYDAPVQVVVPPGAAAVPSAYANNGQPTPSPGGPHPIPVHVQPPSPSAPSSAPEVVPPKA
ncbi:LITAF-like zinc ribbon domain [Geosmithia morbida]|uniref:LITAF-like zinc ribbon domain n=1 Tax=Geosmithia morbida TaxID=1094350 RepID=A0A9P4YQY1_9HYPO|nr:LITAF-like zinc ribbon domain [Geosmithia morbida]KAF4120942.1 LITAF-like zinc ribbon domain [Geosmithia morbida]